MEANTLEPKPMSLGRMALRTFVSLIAAAVGAAILVAILFSTSLARQGEAWQGLTTVTNAGIVFVFALAFTAAFTLLLGLPAALIGIKLRAIHWWTCLLFGFLIGFLPSVLAVLKEPWSALPMGAFGAMGGLIFWLVWRAWK